MDRRSFLKGILAAGVAPAICRADWLMRSSGILVPQLSPIGLSGRFSVADPFYPSEHFSASLVKRMVLFTSGKYKYQASMIVDHQPGQLIVADTFIERPSEDDTFIII